MPAQQRTIPLERVSGSASLNEVVSEKTTNSDPIEVEKKRKTRLHGKPAHAAAVYISRGGAGVGSKPDKPRRCDRCSTLHRPCARPLRREEAEHVLVYGNGEEDLEEVNPHGRCKRCVDDKRECTTSLPKPRKQRKRKLREGEETHPGPTLPTTSHTSSWSSRITGPQSYINSRMNISTMAVENLRPSSQENGIRRVQQAGNLRTELLLECRTYIKFVELSIDIYFIFDMFDEFLSAFDRCGRDPRGGAGAGGGLGLQMGRWGEIKCALYVAAGAHVSKHSAILGCDSAKLRLQALGDSFSSSLVPGDPARTQCKDHSATSARSAYGDGDLKDLRAFGSAREPVLRNLWKICSNIIERSGILEVGRPDIPSTAEVVLLLDTFTRLSPRDLGPFRRLTHSKAIEHWRRCKVGVAGGFPDEQARLDCFENLLQDDLFRVMCDAESPAVSTENDILTTMASPTIDPRVFIRYEGPESIPRAENLWDQHQIIWASGLCMQRLIANLGATINNLPSPRGELILERMLSLLQSREEWRKTTYRIEEIDGHEVRMQEFGREIESSTDNDYHMMQISWFCLLRTIERRVLNIPNEKERLTSIEKKERLEILRHVWNITSDEVDQKLLEIHETFPSEFGDWAHFRARLHDFTCLPGGYRYFVRYLHRARNRADFERRHRGINKTLALLRKYSYNGGHFLRWLLELEDSIREETAPRSVGFPSPKPPFVHLHRSPIARLEEPGPRPPPPPYRASSTSRESQDVPEQELLFPESVAQNLVDSILQDISSGDPILDTVEANEHNKSTVSNKPSEPPLQETLAKQIIESALQDITRGYM